MGNQRFFTSKKHSRHVAFKHPHIQLVEVERTPHLLTVAEYMTLDIE